MPVELLTVVVALAIVACPRQPSVVPDPSADRPAVHDTGGREDEQ